MSANTLLRMCEIFDTLQRLHALDWGQWRRTGSV